MLATKKTTTTTNQEFGIDDEHWNEIQKMFVKRDETRKLEESAKNVAARIEERKREKSNKKKKIASVLLWINMFISSTAIYLFIIKDINKIVAVDDTRFFGYCFFAYLLIAILLCLVGEYIELRIWDKDNK